MITAIEKVKQILLANQQEDAAFDNFVLQGGAGSGKTESLKEIIAFIAATFPEKKIACITHTNVAVDEIKKRVGSKYEISTIHSFLNNLIKKYKKNLHEVISEIYHLPLLKEGQHDKYKSAYEKYARKIYSLKKISSPGVVGKRLYDADPKSYIDALNADISILNQEINAIVATKDRDMIKYNETRFDSFEDLTFSHDSLLYLAERLAEKFDLFPKIVSDKYDFIFIDEYQDSSGYTIDIFLKLLPTGRKTTVGLFGDSMQGIYEDGIGTVLGYVEQGLLKQIEKSDNYRCSRQVVDFINMLRDDGIRQDVALKNGETAAQREGQVRIYYSVVSKKPHARSSAEDKKFYYDELDRITGIAKTAYSGQPVKQLFLTNKSIAADVGFPVLYEIFNDRYSEVSEEIEKDLARIHAKEIAELFKLYQTASFNELIIRIKKNGYSIKTVDDKDRIASIFDALANEPHSIQSAIEYGFDQKIIRKSERYKNFLSRRDDFLKEKDKDEEFKKLEQAYLTNGNTVKRLSENHGITLTNEEFNDFENELKKKTFYTRLLSDQVMFSEVLGYQRYVNEETEYITMHKTKGSGIDNVIVVMEEFFWNRYNFSSIYDPAIVDSRKLTTQKLFYVACSRAIKDLVVVKIVEDESEEQRLKDYFLQSKFVMIEKV